MTDTARVDAIVELSNHNRSMVSQERVRRVQMHQIMQAAGYLVDAAVQTEAGDYIVPAACMHDFMMSLFPKTEDVV